MRARGGPAIPGEAAGAIFGYTTTLDLTALDVLRKNPRYLTRAKSIDTFFSFGPVVVTANEIADVNGLEVITEHNGGVCSRDFVANMRHSPFELVRFHSNFMTLYPGDLISTGCPKGARIMAATGQFNPWGMVWFFQIMTESYGPGQNFWLRDHPLDQVRIADLANEFRADPATFGKYKDTQQKDVAYW